METGTFLQENVKEFLKEHFVGVRYSSGKAAEQFYRFQISATPSFVILNDEGDEILRWKGYLEPEEFLKQLDEARTGKG